MPEHLLIVGFGMASSKLLQSLDHLAYKGSITVIGNEGPRAYNRIHLSSIAVGREIPDDFWLADEAWCRNRGIKLVTGNVSKIDPDSRLVVTEKGQALSWDKLVIATGARAFEPPIAGIQLKGVHVLRTIDDAAGIRAEIRHGRPAVVVGGGVLGLEMADRLSASGVPTTIVHQADWPMENQLDAEAGLFLSQCLEKSGQYLRLAAEVAEIQGVAGTVRSVLLSDGTRIPAQTVVVSCGIRPEIGLAKEAGIKTSNGIVVDENLETNITGVFAIGDCAEHQGKVWGLISPSYAMAATLAGSLCGKRTRFENPGSVSLRLNAANPVLVIGHASRSAGQTHFSDAQKGVYRRVSLRNEKISEAVCIGDEQDFDEIEYFSENIFEGSAARLIMPRELRESPLKPSTWHDELIICHCNRVSVGDIRNAISNGVRNLGSLSSTTHAGSGCGTCRSKLLLFFEPNHASLGSPDKTATGKRFIEIKGYSLSGFLSNILNYVMFIGFAVSLLTGIVKFPGLLGLLGISLRKVPLPEIMILHDWGSIAFSAAAILHLIIHTRQMIRFVADLFRKKPK